MLVVGASSTGVQLAHELAVAGREVVLAVGSHTRMPRRYRGMDIMWWLQQAGDLDTTIDDVPDPRAARCSPSMQLVGRPDNGSIDLNVVQQAGVRLTGRAVGFRGTDVWFEDDLASSVAASDRRLERTLSRVDAHIDRAGLVDEVDEASRPAAIQIRTTPAHLDLRRSRIRTVLWATGFEQVYPWLHVPVVGDNGIVHRRGITASPGLYVLGLRFQHHRNSNFIDGVGRDAAFLADRIARSHATNTEAAA